MTEPREPLTAPDCDLRDFAFMPLDVVRLRDSDLSAVSSGDEFRCAVLLWCASWHQVPAASLPDDDVVLSQFAGYGRVIKEWLKVKDGSLRGWVKCSDGRLYHPVIAEKANEAMAGKIKYRAKKEADRKRKEELNTKDSGGKQKKSGGIPTESDLIGKGIGKGTGTGTGILLSPDGDLQNIPTVADVRIALRAAGLAAAGEPPTVQVLINKGATVQLFVDAYEKVRSTPERANFNYVIKMVETEMEKAARLAGKDLTAPSGNTETPYQRSMREKWEEATGNSSVQPSNIIDITPLQTEHLRIA